MIFGAVGIFGYFDHLAWRVFERSLLFPFVLSFLGILIILARVTYQRRQTAIETFILEHTPGFLKKRFPSERH